MLGPQHLAIWDHATATRPAHRGCVMVWGFADSLAASPTDVAAWPVGDRERVLLETQRAAFGNMLELQAPCPACAETAAFSVEIDALLAVPPANAWPLRVVVDDLVLECRRPSTMDLDDAWRLSPDPVTARLRLFRACVRLRTQAGEAVHTDAVGEAVIAAAAAALGEADPQADIRFSLICPACSQSWETLFDPGLTFWRRFDSWARGWFDDVQRLSLAYGWSERDILAMHPARRRMYLDAAS